MITCGQPLLRKGSDEKGCHGKLNSRGGKGKHRPQQTSQHAARHPVALVEQRDQKAVEIGVSLRRRMSVAEQGVGFIRQREDHIGAVLPGVFVTVDHGNTVKEMPRVYHDRRQDSCEDRSSAGEQTDTDILHRPCINEGTHGKSPQNTISGIPQENSKAGSQHHIARQNRKGLDKGLFNNFLIHSYISFTIQDSLCFCFLYYPGLVLLLFPLLSGTRSASACPGPQNTAIVPSLAAKIINIRNKAHNQFL